MGRVWTAAQLVRDVTGRTNFTSNYLLLWNLSNSLAPLPFQSSNFHTVYFVAVDFIKDSLMLGVSRLLKESIQGTKCEPSEIFAKQISKYNSNKVDGNNTTSEVGEHTSKHHLPSRHLYNKKMNTLGFS
jgi:hypothetical protein